MADVTNFKIGSKTYNVKDETARDILAGYKPYPTFDFLKNRKILFVADSYGTGHGLATPFTTLIINKLNNGSRQVSVGGAGFYQTPTFLSNLQAANIQNPETFTDVVVCGGYNDGKTGITYAQLAGAIDTFFNYVKQRFVNARLWLMPLGWCSDNPTIRYRLAYTTYSAYADGAAANDVIFVDSIQRVLHVYSRFSDDYVHPNQDGQNKIADYVRQALIGGVPKIAAGGDVQWQVRDGQLWNTTAIITEGFDAHASFIRSGIINISYSQAINFQASRIVDILRKPFNAGYSQPGGQSVSLQTTNAYARINNAGDVVPVQLVLRNANTGGDYTAIALYTPLAISNVTTLRLYSFNIISDGGS